MTGVFAAELRKLAAQLPARVLALACVLGPFAFGAVLQLQSGVPGDALFGAWVHSSGFAVSLVVLGFAGSWGFPVIASVVAGDLFASEDRYGTWKTLLTRSRTRRDVFAGKVLAAAAVAIGMLLLVAVSSLVAGLAFTGGQSVIGLSGTEIEGGTLWLVVPLSWLVSMLPLLGFLSLAVLFSIATRNGIIGVLGPILVALVMQLLALFGSGVWVHLLLLGSAFDDWHGLLTAPRFYSQLEVSSAVSVGWIVVCLGASWVIVRRRDFAGPPVARVAGWFVPARAAIVSAVLLAVAAAGTSWGAARITPARVHAAIEPTFDSLTTIQQIMLGRHVPPGSKLDQFSYCKRRGTQKVGPGDDWYCTFDVLIPELGAIPYADTPITYDLSIKANGCYKAESPPLLVGPQTFKDAQGKIVVNPLFTIYGCFDPV